MLGISCPIPPPPLSVGGGKDHSHRPSPARKARKLPFRRNVAPPPPPPKSDITAVNTAANTPSAADYFSSSPTSLAAPQTVSPTRAPSLLTTASAAQWRRKGGSLNDLDTSTNKPSRGRSPVRPRAASIEVLPIAGMEEVHGVDVSWLHKPNKDAHNRKFLHTRSTPDVKKDVRAASPAKPPPAAAQDDAAKTAPASQLSTSAPPTTESKSPSFPNVTPPTPVEPAKDTTPAFSAATATSPPSNKNIDSKRPLFGRERSASEKGSKRASWMNSLSSKFSPSVTPERPAPTPAQPSKKGPATPPATNGDEAVASGTEPYTPARPKESSSSFFSSLKRSLSATSQNGGIPKVQGTGGVCERRILNVDPNRERCNVPDMDSNKLRRVSFCVDVEIAGGNKNRDFDEDEDKERKKKEVKMKEKAEGEALKHPEAIKEEKDDETEPASESLAKSSSPGAKDVAATANHTPLTEGTEEEKEAAARKREKKKQSEAERKERKEKRRRRAEESGVIPVELPLGNEPDDNENGAALAGSPPSTNGIAAPTTPMQPQPNANRSDRPTTDPVRIYRRCCQLRESPILKRITEQLMHPKCMAPQEPGIVGCLDLTGSRLQLADVVTLGDWLAVVPVKHLKLEDADLSDEGVRCILAGLLAAKKPAPTKRKSLTPKHREGVQFTPHQERSGVVEKITLKFNPRITRVGWKYISLFIFMCRSLRCLDLSLNPFPDTLPPSTQITPMKNSQITNSTTGGQLDAAEALYQCLSERLGGKKLEELIMSECDLTAKQIKKIVEGVQAAGVRRLGLAGNHIDDESFESILDYLRSGMCQALDVGSNDLRGKIGSLGEAMTTNIMDDMPTWGLCLSNCNLDVASLKPLFPQLVKLPSFRFIDISHNRDLGGEDNNLITLLGKYIAQFPDLKRIHLADVNLSPQSAISLSNILPEGPKLAHVNLLENPRLTALANAKTESDQEEACALYASLMTAARVSSTLICIDIDVPSADNSEVVKALAKQVVAYSLRNVENFALSETTGDDGVTANVTAALTAQHGGEKSVKENAYPEVLMQLVGHVDGVPGTHDTDDPAPDEDYIVGGTGVVKALQSLLGDKASAAASPTGATTPISRPSSSAGLAEQGKAKVVSKNLLGSARKIRERLQPALLKEATGKDEAAYRRLLFLDHTLQSIIERFEEEYPETRLVPPSPKDDGTASNRSSLTDRSQLATSHTTQATDLSTAPSDGSDEEEEEGIFSGSESTLPHRPTRQGSDVNLISRAQTAEEGRLHRMGQQLRREVLDSPANVEFKDVPWLRRESDQRYRNFATGVENLSGDQLRQFIDEEGGWAKAMQALGGAYADLRHLQEEDPEAWELFKEAQEKARLNLER